MPGKRSLGKRKKTSKKSGKRSKKGRKPSAFFFFSSKKRAEVRSAHPDWKVTEIATDLGKQWRGLSDAEKQAWQSKANAKNPR
jgi:hypothetical protein